MHFVHPREHHAYGRVQRDGEHRGDGHREVLGVGERFKQTAFLVHQCEHR